MVFVEVCVDSLEGAMEAWKGGAKRLEVCGHLPAGGLTPSVGLVQSILNLRTEEHQQIAYSFPEVHVMIRPRAGDFLYSRCEQITIATELKLLASLYPPHTGLLGFVMGALTEDGDVDVHLLELWSELCPLHRIVIHRCVDMSKNVIESVDSVVTKLSRGVHGILTSGGGSTAIVGITVISALVQKYPTVEIMAGCGVTANNVVDLVRSTGVKWVHLSAKTTAPSLMKFRKDDCDMGKESKGNEFVRTLTSGKIVAEVLSLLRDVN
eukprot:PhF_6_TR15500/c0_g1_i2/m.24124/K06201/cutC; copper homeostasis protein